MDGGCAHLIGDPIPWFSAKSITGDVIDIHVDGGRYVVLSFMGEPASAEADFDPKLGDLLCVKSLLRDDHMVCYGILTVPPPQRSLYWLIKNPSLVFLTDYDLRLTKSFGFDGKPTTVVLDTMLRVMATVPLDHPEGHGIVLGRLLNSLPAPHDYLGAKLFPPILILPGLLEPEFCQRMIAYYHRVGGMESGFMLDHNGQTSTVTNYGLKRRSDVRIEDPDLVEGLRSRIVKRLVPAMELAFTFKVTRMDRDLICEYSGETGGHFFRHRDNLNAGARHRRFALSINLNGDAGQYEGGEVRFPEFSAERYKAPTGGAVVFSCGLLHEVMPVTSGNRYAMVAFLYGEEDARIRAANNALLAMGETLYVDGHDRLVPEAVADHPPPKTKTAAAVALSHVVPVAAEPSDISGWVPIQVTPDATQKPVIKCLEMGQAPFDSPFFSQTVSRFCDDHPQARFHSFSVESLFREVDETVGMTPSGLIFHLSRCGSTLVTQMLGAVTSHLVMSEPEPINDVLGPQWGHVGEPFKQQMIGGLLRLLGRPRSVDQSKYFIKFSSWNTAFLPTLLGVVPDCPKVFVYRDPVEVMVSLMREPAGWMSLMSDPLMGGWLIGCPAWMLGWMSQEEFAARLLARILERVWDARDQQWLLVNYSELPQAVVGRVLPRFGVTVTPQQAERLKSVTLVHAKDPSGQRRFVADSDDKRQAASPEILRVVEQFLQAPYDRLEALRQVQLEFTLPNPIPT